MGILIDHSDAQASCNSVPTESKRLRQLVLVHVLLGITLVAGVLVPPHETWYLPRIVALFSILHGQIILLSFWVGMGTNKVIWRLLGALLGSAYLAVPPILFAILSPDSTETFTAERLSLYGAVLVTFFGLVLAFSGGFWLMRRWYSDLRRVPDPRASAQPRFQYSILHLLLFTTVAAIFLGLTRTAVSRTGSVTQEALAVMVLLIAVFLINSLCAARAALGTERIGLPVFLVCVVAILLGVALAVVRHQETSLWWLLFPCCILATSVPTVIVIVSLLVVRSCGYWLIRKRAAPA